MNDTSPEQQEEYFERLRRLTPEERLNIVSRLNRGVRRMAMLGLKMRHPEASAEELRVRLAVRIYGREIAQRMFADIPADAV
jgi:hypothetical protein